MNSEWIISLLSVVGIGLCAYAARFLQGSWVAPGAIFAGVWFVAAGLPLLLLPSDVIFPTVYVLLFLISFVSVLGTSIPVTWKKRGSQAVDIGPRRLQALGRAYWLVLGIGSISPIILYTVVGASFSGDSLVSLASSVTKARYTEGFVSPLPARVCDMFLYTASFLGGFIAAVHPTPRKTFPWCLLVFIPALVTTMLLTTRAMFVFCTLNWIAAAIAGMAYRGSFRQIRLGRVAVVSLTGLSVLFGLFVLVQMFRYGSLDQSRAGDAANHVNTYFTGHIAAFGDWYDRSGQYPATPEMGKITFAGVSEVLGVYTPEMGLFSDFVSVAEGESTNIYTAFRAIIQDFTVPGALLFVFVLSVVGGFGWVSLRRGRLGGAAILAPYVSFVLMTPITSIFAYTSLVGAVVVFASVVVWLSLLPAGNECRIMELTLDAQPA